GYTFYYDNGTGIYYNDTYVQVNTQSSLYLLTIIKRLNSTCNSNVRFFVQINDTCGFLRNSSIGQFQTTC
ncbi:MAG: hypothetical protein N3E37_05350, partial [Candidatus Micrarchaeota archaeon]|nr:hypothetical protein [Candidatus Micrarchaeota archaeon]